MVAPPTEAPKTETPKTETIEPTAVEKQPKVQAVKEQPVVKNAAGKKISDCYIIEVKKKGAPKFDPQTGEKKRNSWTVTVPQSGLAQTRKTWPSLGIEEVAVIYDPTQNK